jgi:hypothetical protein
MIPITMIDLTGLQTARDVIENLRTRNVAFVVAGRVTEWRLWGESRGLQAQVRSFPTLRAAIKCYARENAQVVPT